MLGKLLSPLTTATSTGVVIRYLTAMVGAVLAIAGALQWLTPEQAEEILKQSNTLIGAIGGLAALFVTIYAANTKSSTDKAAEVAKQVDAKIAPNEPVEIITEGNAPNIKVPATK